MKKTKVKYETDEILIGHTYSLPLDEQTELHKNIV